MFSHVGNFKYWKEILKFHLIQFRITSFLVFFVFSNFSINSLIRTCQCPTREKGKMSKLIIPETQYTVDPSRMDEITVIENRIQCIKEEMSTNYHQTEERINKIHQELKTYKVKIENFFTEKEEHVIPTFKD